MDAIEAIKTLPRLNAPQAIDGLKPLLSDSSEPVREAAMFALIDEQKLDVARQALLGADGVTKLSFSFTAAVPSR